MAPPLTPLFTMPLTNTDAGAMANLFLNEAAGPHRDGTMTVQAMGWMRCVLQNRLRHPAAFGALGATRITQIITAAGYGVQFAGFNTYPAIDPAVAANIQAKLAIAANTSYPRQPIYLAFVKAAIAAATGPAPADPCPTNLYSWRTGGAAGPGGKSVFYQSLDGNDFYTLTASFFPASHKKK